MKVWVAGSRGYPRLRIDQAASEVRELQLYGWPYE